MATTQKVTPGNLYSAGRSSDMMKRQSGSAKNTFSSGRSSDMLKRSSDGATNMTSAGRSSDMKAVTKTHTAKVLTTSPFHGKISRSTNI